jgi:hypothetical protein
LKYIFTFGIWLLASGITLSRWNTYIGVMWPQSLGKLFWKICTYIWETVERTSTVGYCRIILNTREEEVCSVLARRMTQWQDGPLRRTDVRSTFIEVCIPPTPPSNL